jgi:tryptophan-rich sensory protein
MKNKIKDIISFIIILFPWLISGILFPYNKEFYEALKIPSFALPGVVIGITWLVLYVLISISIYIISKKINILKNNDYLYILITNYLANQLFSFAFFYLMSPFLAFVMTAITFISSIFFFIETKEINKKASYFLIPYIIFSGYALIVSLSVYIMNF